MPYTPAHKEKSRERIVASARRLFNRRGYSEISIDQIMADAGLTRGGFYNHFKNKEELFAVAIASRTPCHTKEGGNGNGLDYALPAPELARRLIDVYLSRNHLDDVDNQCPLIALPSDVARAGPAIKATYQHLFEGMVHIFEQSLADDQMPGRANAKMATHDRALALAATCVGGMVLAKSFDDPALADKVLAASRKSALAILHPLPETEPA